MWLRSRRSIREQDPLKQGLKQEWEERAIDNYSIREQDPLKQGLKPKEVLDEKVQIFYSRARSIKTRIETPSNPMRSPLPSLIREQDPLKQGLKQKIQYGNVYLFRFASKIH